MKWVCLKAQLQSYIFIQLLILKVEFLFQSFQVLTVVNQISKKEEKNKKRETDGKNQKQG